MQKSLWHGRWMAQSVIETWVTVKNNQVSHHYPHKWICFHVALQCTLRKGLRCIYKRHCIAVGPRRWGGLLGRRIMWGGSLFPSAFKPELEKWAKSAFTCRCKRSSTAPLDSSYGNKCQVSAECDSVTKLNTSCGVPMAIIILCKCLVAIVLSGRCLSAAQARLVRAKQNKQEGQILFKMKRK